MRVCRWSINKIKSVSIWLDLLRIATRFTGSDTDSRDHLIATDSSTPCRLTGTWGDERVCFDGSGAARRLSSILFEEGDQWAFATTSRSRLIFHGCSHAWWYVWLLRRSATATISVKLAKGLQWRMSVGFPTTGLSLVSIVLTTISYWSHLLRLAYHTLLLCCILRLSSTSYYNKKKSVLIIYSPILNSRRQLSDLFLFLKKDDTNMCEISITHGSYRPHNGILAHGALKQLFTIKLWQRHLRAWLSEAYTCDEFWLARF